jgi:hypothetical protein
LLIFQLLLQHFLQRNPNVFLSIQCIISISVSSNRTIFNRHSLKVPHHPVNI